MSDDNEFMEKIKKLSEQTRKERQAEPVREPYGKELEGAREIEEEQEAEEQKPVNEPKPKQKRKPRKPKDSIELSQEQFKALMEMAKKADMQAPENPIPEAPKPVIEKRERLQTLGDVIEEEKQQAKTMQPTMQPDEQEQVDVRQVAVQQEDFADILKNPMVLYFDTEKTCSIIQPKLNKDGSIKVHDRVFDFVEGQPSVIKFKGNRGSTSHPFYIIKYDNMKPLDMSTYPSSNPTPEETTRLVDLQTLQTLSQISGARLKKLPIIILMSASFMGGIVVKLVLSLSGVW